MRAHKTGPDLQLMVTELPGLRGKEKPGATSRLGCHLLGTLRTTSKGMVEEAQLLKMPATVQ
jgi:hypothetical protein